MKGMSWEDTVETLFRGLGLSEKESKIYRILLTIGRGSAATVVAKAGLKRGITYAILHELEKLGFIKTINIEGKSYFQAENPVKLLDLVEERKREIEAISESIQTIGPKLISQYKLAIGKPVISYYEGNEGIKAVFEDIYAPKKDIVYGCVDLEISDKVFPKYITDNLIPKRIKNKVIAHSFIGKSDLAREVAKKDRQQLRKSCLVDKGKYHLPAEIDIYEDKVAMLSFIKGDFIGLVIENKDIAQSLRSIFRLAFGKKKNFQ